MSPRTPEPAGVFRYRHPIEVRFVDTDALGHINNATYLSYFEAARAGYYLAVMGTPFGVGEGAERYTFLIAEARITYRAPGLFGEPVTVECRVSWASRSSFGIEYRVLAGASAVGEARLLADGDTVQVMFDVKRERVGRVPPDLLERFAAFEGHAIGSRPRPATAAS
jgi:acyl-CoA thioester hydrolase